ncbi:hypothetical protein AND_001886 [Anopheles darlingi]|uniref:Uncharacterized protein n=1 Tax=Anopheles darlingi TaxID=43151 RepID=W5JQC6_ANODA|nr:hypothetical protein AND_001886 [Anopheles darlingi]
MGKGCLIYSGALLLQGMTYMDGDTAMDYQPPVPRSSTVDDADADDDDDDDDVDGQSTRYGFYLYEQVYGTIYPPVPRTGARRTRVTLASHNPTIHLPPYFSVPIQFQFDCRFPDDHPERQASGRRV